MSKTPKTAQRAVVPNVRPHFVCVVCDRPVEREGGHTTARNHVTAAHGFQPAFLANYALLIKKPVRREESI